MTLNGGDVLLTHAGLTVGFWEELGGPTSASGAAASLNRLLYEDRGRAFRAGWLTTRVVDPAAGPVWARCGSELSAPWLARGSMPFHQVHGHEGVFWWPGGHFHEDAPQSAVRATSVDEGLRFGWVTVGDHRLVSVDWALLDSPPRRRWRPLVLGGVVAADPMLL